MPLYANTPPYTRREREVMHDVERHRAHGLVRDQRDEEAARRWSTNSATAPLRGPESTARGCRTARARAAGSASIAAASTEVAASVTKSA